MVCYPDRIQVYEKFIVFMAAGRFSRAARGMAGGTRSGRAKGAAGARSTGAKRSHEQPDPLPAGRAMVVDEGRLILGERQWMRDNRY